MKRITLALIFIFISQVLPLLFKPEMILRFNNVVVMIANAAIWLTQPPVSGAETKENKSRDKFSVLLILLCSFASIFSGVVDWAYVKESAVSQILLLIGLCLMIFGIAFRVWAIQTLGKFFTATVQIKEDHSLITKGPYSWVRHPSYLGAWATIAGAAVFFGSYTALAIAITGMGFSYYIRMDLEEKALAEVFGKQYTNYQKKVKKIIPFVW